LVRDGHGHQVCLSHDSICGGWLGRPIFAPNQPIDPAIVEQMLPQWEPTHLFQRVIPKLRNAGVPEEAITAMTDENPRRWFQGVTS
jgi:phosphotriesterase-related protein